MIYESPYTNLLGRPFRLSEFIRQYQGRMNAWTHTLATTTPQGVGMAASVSAGGTQTFVANSNGAWINGATAATIDLISGRTGIAPQFQHLPAMAYVIETGSSFADVRWWIGAGVNLFGTGQGDDPSINGDFLGFRASSTTDASWYIFTADLSTTTTAGYNTGVEITVSTRYDFLWVQQTQTEAYGFIGTGADQPMAGPFPIAVPTGIVTTATSNNLCAIVENKANSAKFIRHSKFWYSRR